MLSSDLALCARIRKSYVVSGRYAQGGLLLSSMFELVSGHMHSSVGYRFTTAFQDTLYGLWHGHLFAFALVII